MPAPYSKKEVPHAALKRSDPAPPFAVMITNHRTVGRAEPVASAARPGAEAAGREQARTQIEAWRATDRAEGFAQGIETLRALNPGEKRLYMVFEAASQARLEELGR